MTSDPVPFLEGQRRRRDLPPRPHTGLPPHDVAAEEATIAALLLDDDALPRVQPIVQPQDFFREQNGWIFACCLAIWTRGEPVTIPTVAHELDRAGKLDAAGGEPYLVELAGKYFTAVGVEAHARIVARDAGYRRLIQTASRIAEIAYDGGPDLEAALAQSEAMLLGLHSTGGGQGLVPVGDIVATMDPDGDDERKVTSGFGSIDRVTNGLTAGQVSLIGGRRDSAKTALTLSMSYNQANRYGVRVGYFSFEDSPQNAIVRLAGGVMAGLDPKWGGWQYMSTKAKSRTITAAEYARYREEWPGAMDVVRSEESLHMVEPGSQPRSFDELEHAIRLARLTRGVEVFYIDYIDVVPKEGFPRGMSEASILDEMMRRLMALSVRLDVHIVVISQVSVEGEKANGNPVSSKFLLGSGGKARQARALMMVGLVSEHEIYDHRRAMPARIETLKGYSQTRDIVVPGASAPALYLDVRTGLVREVGE